MAHASELLVENFTLLGEKTSRHGVLDLACGSGKNGLYVAKRNTAVTFADIESSKLSEIRSEIERHDLDANYWQVDLEQNRFDPLAGKQFGACLVFRYLHRPLMPAIKRCLVSGGLVYYETFTQANRKFGRPNNSNFLLAEKELYDYFSDWEILHYFEGEKPDPDRAIAQLIARKP